MNGTNFSDLIARTISSQKSLADITLMFLYDISRISRFLKYTDISNLLLIRKTAVNTILMIDSILEINEKSKSGDDND